MAIIADATEKTTAPLPRPAPFFKANSQKELAIKYKERLAAANQTDLCKDQFFAKISANASKIISNDKGKIHLIIYYSINIFYYHFLN